MSDKKLFMLIDRSGSMENMIEKTVQGINAYVEPLKDIDIQVATFDSYYGRFDYEVIRNCSRSNWRPITQDEIQPRGGTPLLDAAGRMMWSMMDSGARTAILVIMTDGYENESKLFRRDRVQLMLSELTSKYNYDVVFLGANFDSIGDVANKDFAFNDKTRIMNLNNNTMVRGMSIAASASQQYFETGIRAQSFYTEKDKKDLGQ